MTRARAPRVVGLGLCVVDHVWRVEDDPREPRTRSRDRGHLKAPGGMVSNALRQAAALGCRAELLSTVGEDADGRWLLREMRRAGVRTRGVRTASGAPTSEVLVLVDGRGGRRFVVPDRREIERSAAALDLTGIDRAGVLLIDGHYSEQALQAAQRARARGVPVVADFTRPKPAFLRLLPWVDTPVLPQDFAEPWAGSPREACLRLREEFGANPVVTVGRRGCLAFVGERLRRIPAPRVRTVDATGAGDVFHGALAAALAHGVAWPRCLAIASRAAAHSCTALGAGTALLDQEAFPELASGAATA